MAGGGRRHGTKFGRVQGDSAWRVVALSSHSDEADPLVLRRVGGDSLSRLKAAGSSELVRVEVESLDAASVFRLKGFW